MAGWLSSLALLLVVAVSAGDDIPHALLIVHGHEFATERVPIFLRTALAARGTSPLHLHVLVDAGGHDGFREVWQAHAVAPGLVLDGDELDILVESALPPLASQFLGSLHPLCPERGYGYLFLKVLAGELLPTVDRIMVLDPDSIVLGSLADLWREFDAFVPEQLLSMAVDQSDRYYYRLQNPRDELFSPGWEGVPHGVGVNGGVLLFHAARARALGFAANLAALTHKGVSERAAGMLHGFCDLAEQDTLNLAIARQPQIWRPLHCSWNYMATSIGGHVMRPDEELPLTFYDVCPEGVRGSGGATGEDLLRCPCGRKVHLLHFVGGVRRSPMLRQINESVLGATGAELKELARRRAARPNVHQDYSALGEAGEGVRDEL